MDKPGKDKRQAEGVQTTFMRTLIEDVIGAMKMREANDTQSNRRHLIRVLFAAIEGQVWTFREHVTSVAKSSDILTVEEELAFSEASYSVTSQGKIVEQTRFVPLLGMIRLTTRLAERINSNLKADFDDSGWDALRRAIEIRNRITHPKSAADLEISEQDLTRCQAGFNWLFKLCLTAMEATTAALKGYLAQFVELHESLRRGDPATLAEYEAAAKSLKE
jgi:hypothetical protein